MNNNRSIDRFKIMTVLTSTALVYGLALSTAQAQSTNLATKTGHEIGVTGSAYKYTEPGLVTIKANKLGLDYTGTYAIGSQWPNRSEGWFLRADLRYANGKGDYSSSISGAIKNAPDWYYEVRGLVGKDFDQGGYVLAPYAGIAFRHLDNDLRGVSTTGAKGYRRESNYTTIPLGVTHKMKLDRQMQLDTTVEYAHLVRGKADSKLSDALPTLPDVSLTQRNGYGLRLATMVRFGAWSVGPSVIIWRIKDSDRAGTLAIIEPKNNTVEVGIKAAYSF